MIKQSYLFLFAFCIIAACRSEIRDGKIESPYGWEILDVPSNASIRGLSALTSEIIWASGTKGTWLLTTDGGRNWATGIIAGLDTVDFRDIEALSASTAIAISAGQPALVCKTTDGGATWEIKYEGPKEAFLDGMSFYSDKKGFIIGDPIDGKWMVLETQDAGESWTWLDTSPKAEDGEGSFAASGSTIIAQESYVLFCSGGSQSKTYHSENGGRKWIIKNTPIIQGQPSQGIFSLSRLNDQNVIGVGGDYLQPDLAESNVIIANLLSEKWALPSGDLPTGYRSGVAYFPRYHWAIAVGPNGSDYSNDGGASWARFSDEGFHAVVMDKAQGTVWASGSDGKIGKLLY
ncbi:YCF48-related protein [Belliella kenyensis]|uniref:YCF48-related protein n=1 Tax=Belliella kenyensis TaxID=1472724 RepID=A0ABV8ESJ3_9BACT|nr:YCF48-related protein [Belliella kenyensis]MCH7402627.1 YCF48-related protein [Belliella kenyensis]MDN3603425.1 YCF48-related protein [Belliella kenyensis]